MIRKDSQETSRFTTPLITRVDPELADAFKAVAASRDRSAAAELRRMIRAEVDRADLAEAEREAAA